MTLQVKKFKKEWNREEINDLGLNLKKWNKEIEVMIMLQLSIIMTVKSKKVKNLKQIIKQTILIWILNKLLKEKIKDILEVKALVTL